MRGGPARGRGAATREDTLHPTNAGTLHGLKPEVVQQGSGGEARISLYGTVRQGEASRPGLTTPHVTRVREPLERGEETAAAGTRKNWFNWAVEWSADLGGGEGGLQEGWGRLISEGKALIPYGAS